MAKRMVTRSITAPMVYIKGKAEGIHLPNTTLKAAESMVAAMGFGDIEKVVMETKIYELDEEIFLQYALIKEPKEKKEK